jgi:hypothetical protein
LAGLAREDPEFFHRSVPSLPTGGAFAWREGACVLLGEDGLCQAHRYFGAEAKGTICRLFPYLFVEAPEGGYTGYSFCCRPVRDPGELTKTSEVLRESPEAAYEEARSFFPGVHYRKAPECVAISQDLEIAWDDYLALESGLLELLGMETGKPGDSLVCGSVYLTLSGLFLKDAADGKNRRLSRNPSGTSSSECAKRNSIESSESPRGFRGGARSGAMYSA